jgi:hypothetical protein
MAGNLDSSRAQGSVCKILGDFPRHLGIKKTDQAKKCEATPCKNG